MKTITLKCYSDPNNSWIEVPRSLLTHDSLWLISIHSYENGDMLYLDMKYDGSSLIRNFSLVDIEVQLDMRHSNTPSVVRTYKRFYYNPYNPHAKGEYRYDFNQGCFFS